MFKELMCLTHTEGIVACIRVCLQKQFKNEILEHNSFLDVATFRVINTLRFVGFSSLLPESDLLWITFSLSLFLSLSLSQPGLGSRDNRQTWAERKLLSPKQKQWIKYTLYPGISVNPPMMTVLKVKQGFMLSWSPLRCVCNQGPWNSYSKYIKVYA